MRNLGWRLLADFQDLNKAVYYRVRQSFLGLFKREDDWVVRHRQMLSSPAESQVTIKAYERLLIILIILASAMIAHWLTLKLWESVSGEDTTGK